MACATCDDFCGDVRIDRADILRSIIDAVAPAIEEERLVIDRGSLDWLDRISCDLHCRDCDQRFELVCESYHGSGGKWTAIGQ